MEFVQNLPLIDWKIDSENSIVSQDFLMIYQISLEWLERSVTDYEWHQLKAGQTPEDLALVFYGDPKLKWIILVSNGIINETHEWFKTENQVINYTFDKNYVKIYKYDKNKKLYWNDVESASVTAKYIDWTGYPENEYKYIPKDCYDSQGNPIVLYPHHFEDSTGEWMPYGVEGSIPVSHLEYERIENLKKRSIKILPTKLAMKLRNSIKNV